MKRVRDLAAPGETVRCEAIRFCDDTRCPHPAKYLAPYDSSAVCGIHARGFLHCIPLSEFDLPSADGSGNP